MQRIFPFWQAFLIAFTLAVCNFGFIAAKSAEPVWQIAADRSYFQAVAVFTVWFVLRITR